MVMVVREGGGIFRCGIPILTGRVGRFGRAGFHRLLGLFAGLWGGGRFSGTQGVYAFQKKSLSSADPAKKEPWQTAATDRLARSETMTFLRSMVGGYEQWVKPEGSGSLDAARGCYISGFSLT
jgi:hypothetical protein